MKITLEDYELEHLIQTCLCDGLHYFGGYGFSIHYDDNEYDKTKELLKIEGEENVCLEDVQTRMIMSGGKITFIDVEDDNTPTDLTLDRVRENYDKIPPSTLFLIMNGEYDAHDADVALQYILFGELIYC